jgi:N-acetylglucosaminyldiphosphoundecaprenol N-acetyl-beta-D-mannosaminyltransferase
VNPKPQCAGPSEQSGSRCTVLGVEVDRLTIPELNRSIAQAIHARTRWIVANHNLHSIYLFHRDANMRAFFRLVDRIHIDGMPIILAGRILGLPLTRDHRITYLDWIDSIFSDAARGGWKVFFVGAAPGVAERGAERLRERYPGLLIATAHGYFDTSPGEIENGQVLKKITDFETDLLIVGMGMPKQEKWVAANVEAIGPRVVLMSGGIMDYVAGVTPVPPRWLASIGLEWFCRLVAEPRRLWLRYLVEPWALVLPFAKDVVKIRLRGRG